MSEAPLSSWALEFAQKLLRENPLPLVGVIVKEPVLLSEEQLRILTGKDPSK